MRGFGGGEIADVDFSVHVRDLCVPFFGVLMPANPFETRSVFAIFTLIMLVLAARCLPEIEPPVVIFHAIYMVGIFWRK